jgi:CSLREA domain-containing protein
VARRRSLLLVLALSAPPAALAATFTVTKTADTLDGACDADCSLREAVAAANATPGADTIVLGAATYRLTRVTPRPADQDDDVTIDEDDNATGDFDITDDLLIRGKRGYTAVDAGLLERVFEILPGVAVEFRDFEIRRGYERERGAGIFNAGTLKLVRMRLRLNLAASGFNRGQGGAVANIGTLSIADSHVLDNVAAGGEASSGEGGGIWNSGRLNVRTTRFIGNLTRDDNDIGGGGAIMNRGGTVSIQRAFFQGNATQMHGSGGALANRDGGRMTVVNATLSANEAGEPPFGGGAVANGTPWAPGGWLKLSFVTVVDNDGGGVFNNGELRLYDSIVAGNYENYGSSERTYAAGNNCVSWTSAIADGNIVGADGNCPAQTGVDNAAALSLVIYPLQNNGGFAPTHALRYFRPALDQGSCGGGCPEGLTDQRGVPRPQDGDGDGIAGWDIGAFERGDDD